LRTVRFENDDITTLAGDHKLHPRPGMHLDGYKYLFKSHSRPMITKAPRTISMPVKK